jgi:methionyl-tRNA formyltransferase
VTPVPVKKRAEELGVPTISPERIRGNSDFIRCVKEATPDLIVVAAYGKILPTDVLEIPPRGCVNLHASLLPKYRGAAPIQRAIEAGEETTGITLMHMSEGMDEGDMIVETEVPILDRDTGELTALLALVGAALLTETFPHIVDGTTTRMPQDGSLATYAPMIEKSEGRIDWDRPAVVIARKVRSMNPAPGAFAYLEKEKVKIRRAHVGDARGTRQNAVPGDILSVSADGICVCTADEVLVIDALQTPGKKAMPTAEFLKGNRITLPARLE